MKEIDKQATEMLLAVLDEEINIKCVEIKERQREEKQNRVFFISCAAVILVFFLQMFFSIFNVSSLFSIILYEIVALVLIIPLIFRVYLGGAIK